MAKAKRKELKGEPGPGSRAVIYTRVSTEEQRLHGYSLDEQERQCLERIKEKGWVHVGTYCDPGVTGYGMAHRPELQRLLADTTADKFDVVICWSLDRLSRKSKDSYTLVLENFLDNHIYFDTLKEHHEVLTPQGRFMFKFWAGWNEYERELIQSRTIMGRTAAAISGKWPGGRPPLGYRLTRDAHGKPQLERDPQTAWIIERIFQAAVKGSSLRSIAHQLQTEGIPTSRPSGSWTAATVRDILQNPVYLGHLVWQRQTRTKTTKTPNPPEDWLEATNAHEPIVDETVFLAARAKRLPARENAPMGKRSHFLLTGLLKCKCGASMVPIMTPKYEGYRCCKREANGSCDMPYISRRRLEEGFLVELAKDLTELRNRPQFQQFVEEAAATIPVPDERAAELSEVLSELAQLDREAERLTKLLRKADDGAEFLLAELNQIAKERRRLTVRKEEIDRQIAASVEALRSTGPLLESLGEDIHDNLLKMDPAARKQVVRQLVEKVQLPPDPATNPVMHISYKYWL